MADLFDPARNAIIVVIVMVMAFLIIDRIYIRRFFSNIPIIAHFIYPRLMISRYEEALDVIQEQQQEIQELKQQLSRKSLPAIPKPTIPADQKSAIIHQDTARFWP
jgi:hypothetical protein